MPRPKGSKNKPKGDAPKTEKPTEAAKSSDVQAVISKPKLLKLMKHKRQNKSDIAEMNGAFGSAVKLAVENDHLHRKAFNTICTLDKMEAEKVRDFLDNFAYYLDISGIQAKADAVNPMSFEGGGDAGDDGEEDDGDGEESNVKPFPAAAGNA